MTRQGWLWALGAGAVVFLGVSPAILGHYGYVDDYTFLHLAQTDPAEIDRIFTGGGRFPGGPIYRALFAWVGTIDRLGIIRLLCALGAAGMALFIARLAQRFGYRPILSFLLGPSLVILPGVLVMGTWATQLVASLAVPLGLCAGSALTKTETGFIRRTLTGAVFLAAGVLFYQPAAMVVWVVWCLWMLSPAARNLSLGTILRTTCAFLLAMGLASSVALVALKIGTSHAHWTGPRASLAANVAGKLKHLVIYVWPLIFNPWYFGAKPFWVAAGIEETVFLGMLILPKMRFGRRLLRVSAVLASLVLGYAPNIASAEEWMSSRTMIALLLIFPVCLIALLEDVIERIQPKASALMTVAAVLSVAAVVWAASFVQANIVIPQEQELAFMRPAVLEVTKAPSLTVMPSLKKESFASIMVSDEIGLPSTSQPWAIIPMVELIYRETHGSWYGHAHLRERGAVTPITDPAVLDCAVLLDRRGIRQRHFSEGTGGPRH